MKLDGIRGLMEDGNRAGFFGEQFDFSRLGGKHFLGGIDVDGRDGSAGDDTYNEENDNDLDKGETFLIKWFT